MTYCYCGFGGKAWEVDQHILRHALISRHQPWTTRTPIHREENGQDGNETARSGDVRLL